MADSETKKKKEIKRKTKDRRVQKANCGGAAIRKGTLDFPLLATLCWTVNTLVSPSQS